MNQLTTIQLYAGGSGSGCNPSVGKCGRIRWRDLNIEKDSPYDEKMMNVPVQKIRIDKTNPALDQRTVDKYFSKMQKGKNIITPSAWKSSGGTYKLEDGHHRFAAAKRFGAKTIRLLVRR